MKCTVLGFFTSFHDSKGTGERGYKLAVLTYAGDPAVTRWPLYVLTKNMAYNNLNPYFSLEYYGWGTGLRLSNLPQ